MFGPPGVGKGTQAKKLAEEFGVAHISTGDMLRAAAAEATPMGKEAKKLMDAGKLVPDPVMIGIVREVLGSPKVAKGFILDGFPRTLEQAKALSQIFEDLKIDDFIVINFEVDDDEIIHRLSNRVICNKSGHIYNTELDGVVRDGPCPDCDGTLIQRDDDSEATVRQRLKEYRAKTAPVVEYYKLSGVVVNIDGMGSIDVVNREIKMLVE